MHHIIKEYSATPASPITLHENKLFKMKFNGNFHYLEGVKYGRGVLMVPYTEDNQFIMVSINRVPEVGLSLEFPRGGVETEESLEDGAIRELKEETGYVISPSDVTLLGRLATETATINGKTDVFALKINTDKKISEFDESEISSIHLISLDTINKK